MMEGFKIAYLRRFAAFLVLFLATFLFFVAFLAFFFFGIINTSYHLRQTRSNLIFPIAIAIKNFFGNFLHDKHLCKNFST